MKMTKIEITFNASEENLFKHFLISNGNVNNIYLKHSVL